MKLSPKKMWSIQAVIITLFLTASWYIHASNEQPKISICNDPSLTSEQADDLLIEKVYTQWDLVNGHTFSFDCVECTCKTRVIPGCEEAK